VWPNVADADVTVLQRNISIGAGGLCAKIAIALGKDRLACCVINIYVAAKVVFGITATRAKISG
jgi:hypothetical protein